MFWSISGIIKNEKPNQLNYVSKEYLPSNSYTILLMEIFVRLFVRGQSIIAVIIGNIFPIITTHNEYENPNI